MAIFEAYTAPHINLTNPISRNTDADSLKFIEDKKHVLALIFPVIWLAWNRLWFWLVAYILVSVLFMFLTSLSASIIVSMITVVPGLFLYLEGRSLIVDKLERSGWRFSGVVDAPDVELAEHKFLFNEIESKNAVPPIDSSAQPIISNTKITRTPNQENLPTIGIFSES